jgi:hypothetical protein
MEEQSNIDKFPGYPHYPGREDITRADNNNGRVRLEKEEVPEPFNNTVDERDVESVIVSGTDADVTEEDLQTLEYAAQNVTESDLHRASLDSTDADGDPLNEGSSLNGDTSGSALDVPGSEADDELEMTGSEDEENNHYSLGGDNHEALEENNG